MDFWKKGRWQDLVDYVKADSYNAEDADVEMLWTIAEAFAKTKQTNDAISVYLSILKSSADQPARLATIQKAMANLRMGDVEKLIAAYLPGGSTGLSLEKLKEFGFASAE